MALIWLDGGRIKTAEDCYEQFFHASQTLVPDPEVGTTGTSMVCTMTFVS